MKKNIMIVVSLVIIISALTFIIFFMKNDKKNTITYTKDEINFKNEYEEYNGIENKDGVLLDTIEVLADNNVNYIEDNIDEYLNNGTNIVYLGSPTDNKSRNLIPILIELTNKNKLDNLYYYNSSELSETYNIDNLELSSTYNNIVNKLGDDLEESIEGTEIKRIPFPIILFIKNGEYMGSVSVTESTEFNDVTIVDLKQKIQNFIDIIDSNVCEEDAKC